MWSGWGVNGWNFKFELNIPLKRQNRIISYVCHVSIVAFVPVSTQLVLIRDPLNQEADRTKHQKVKEGECRLVCACVFVPPLPLIHMLFSIIILTRTVKISDTYSINQEHSQHQYVSTWTSTKTNTAETEAAVCPTWLLKLSLQVREQIGTDSFLSVAWYLFFFFLD